MASDSISLKFQINSVPQEKFCDMRINIKEDYDYLKYGNTFNNINTGISFVESEPITVENNIIVKDQTGSILNNSPRIFSEQTFSTQTFNLTHGKFLITDIFHEQSDGDEEPLYYWHDLSEYSSVDNVEVLDGDFNPISDNSYLYINESTVIGEDRKGVYTNIRSEFDSVENFFTIYYLKFRDVTTGAFHTILLNVKPFYSTVDFNVTSKTRAYSVDVGSGGTADVRVFFDSKSFSPTGIPGSNRFSVKTTGDNRISVIKPVDVPSSEKWHLRINPGEFYQNAGSSVARYYVPEYNSQLFSPIRPFKLLIEKEARIFSSQLIYVDTKPIANLLVSGFFMYVVLKDSLDRPVRALTNDPEANTYVSPEGVVTKIFYEKGTIDSVAEQEGFIRLNTSIDTSLKAHVTYRYIEDYYAYKDIVVNSTLNSDILDKRIIVYLKPELSSSNTKSIFHLLVNEEGNILEANESSNLISIRSTTEGGGIDYIQDSALDGTDEYVGYELEILSGFNAGRKLKIITKEVFYSEVLIGDINFKVNDYTAEYNGRPIKFVDGTSQGNESFSVTESEIIVIIESGATTAQNVVDAAGTSTVMSELEVTTASPGTILSGGLTSAFSEATIRLESSHPFEYSIDSEIEYRINKRLNSYSSVDTIESVTLDYTGWVDEYTLDPHYYIRLADVYGVRSLVPSDILLSDIRTRGGGVSLEQKEEALRAQDEFQWFWDIGYWDGQAYPGMSAILFNLPREILKEVGGVFSRQQVRDIVHRHMAEGSYPIIRYYDKATKIIDVEPGDSEIKITWEDVRATSYNVYIGNNPDVMELYKVAASVETEMTITDLENNKVYFIKVEAVVGGVSTLPSRPVSAIPFNFSIVKPGATYGVTIYDEGTYAL